MSAVSLTKLVLISGALALLSVPSFGMTVPFGGTDGLCTPQFGGGSAGVTTCLVFEGQGDSLLELVINFTGVNILINSVTSGPITFIAGDHTDLITSDPITPGIVGPLGAGPFGVLNPVDCLTKPILAPGGSETLRYTFDFPATASNAFQGLVQDLALVFDAVEYP